MVVLRANSTLINVKQMTASQSVLGIAQSPQKDSPKDSCQAIDDVRPYYTRRARTQDSSSPGIPSLYRLGTADGHKRAAPEAPLSKIR